ncbi:glucosamine-6-phosphate deaminase [Thorsellia anophelis]|uniref:6-phosphogluconolactonase/Glucosamine-6-phosphate isomerase/deaminase n=1 Tax=Thorsellia anophelis DSM 18579 TaxID=1123402 RepID=A0A1I0FD51_9GAMM|nr:glucosamine-6-phosphate deaminase [Thorsellia anophelis]SET55868.1 6-phosphogluconolactonase/Glucosamine-6-phosphateisomerase/deaminase [Thorsellia anophelis DSM 18579]
MNLIIENDYDTMSQTAANLLLAEMLKPTRVNLSITAGNTPKKMYELLIPMVKNKPHFSQVHYYNFDEVPVLDDAGFGITMGNLNKDFFKPANISKEQIHVLDDANYLTHDERLLEAGGLDLILMGIGSDGHFCGNLPGTTEFHDMTVKVNMTEALKAIFLKEVGGDESKVPDYWVTMGPKSVMQSKKLVMFASGKSKAEIIKKAFFGPVTSDVPSSILQMHPNLTLLLDKDAAALI